MSIIGDATNFAANLLTGLFDKAMLVGFDKPGGAELPIYKFDFFLNPKEITVEKSVTLEESQGQGNTRETRWTMTNPVSLKLGEIWFDTYETRENVRQVYVDKLEKLLEYNRDTHHIPCVRFIWGGFTLGSLQDLQYTFYVEKMSATYTMFLPNGTPVRAKVALELKQAAPVETQLDENPKQSPDHAKLYTIKRGDTLQAIAHAEYDDPREWRRIADTNGIDDPMSLRPGNKLLVPPILK
jgi:hypothetical protein